MGKIILLKKEDRWAEAYCPTEINSFKAFEALSPRCYDKIKVMNVRFNKEDKTRPIPMDIYKLKNLQYLDLSGMRLTKISPKIAQLKKLSELILMNSKLSVIPKEIGDLTQLEILDLRTNDSLKEIPEELSKLSKLRFLYLRGTRVERLPLPLCRTMEKLNTYTDEMYYSLCEKWMK